MKTKTAVLITACVTFVSALFLSQYFETRHWLTNISYIDGIGEIYSIGDSAYELGIGDDLCFITSTYANRSIIGNGREYSFENDALYFYSDDGFVIVYPENNMCKVYLLPEQNSVSKITASPEYPKNKLIVYLDSFDEYTNHEKAVLNELVNKHHDKQKRSEK